MLLIERKIIEFLMIGGGVDDECSGEPARNVAGGKWRCHKWAVANQELCLSYKELGK